MKKFSDSHLKRDITKLLYLSGAILGLSAIFFVSPTLSTPTLLSLLITMLLSPLVATLERRGYPRTFSILILFMILGTLLAITGVWATQTIITEWDSFRQRAPEYFNATVDRLKNLEFDLKNRYPFFESIHPTDALVSWGQQTGKWFITNGAALLGDVLTWLLIVPILTFVMLKDGRKFRKRLFDLVPNRFFEVTFIISSQVGNSVSHYLRAKILEAILLGSMVSLGLYMIDAPYAFVLGTIAGVTNIIPYLGPVIGASPGILIPLLDPAHTELLLPIFMVYLIANAIDMILVFPVIVARLVNLHPLILIAVVITGQQYYGLVGMLISIPIASAVKVLIQEIYAVVYQPTDIPPHASENTRTFLS